MISTLEDVLTRILFGVLTLVAAPFLLAWVLVDFALECWSRHE